MKLPLPATQVICGKSIRWILNYRSGRFSASQLAEIDGHSGGSFDWTRRQSNAIDRVGWETWLQTKRARGYKTFFHELLASDH